MVLKHIDVRRKVQSINHKQILLGICIHNYHITSGSVLLSEPEKKIQETPFKLCSLLFQILYTCPKNFIEAASQNIREKWGGLIATARIGWGKKYPLSIAKKQFLLWVFFALSTVSFQFSPPRSLVISLCHLPFAALYVWSQLKLK